MNTLPAYVFIVFIFVTCAFQIALAAGAPWGNLAMGGKFPGKFPPMMRLLAVVQCAVLALFGITVLTRAGIVLPDWYVPSKKLVWAVVVICAISVVANFATPSKWERIIWTPIAAVLLACGLIVALD